MSRSITAPQPKVALAMIVKGSPDEAKLLKRCLDSVLDYVDGAYLLINAPKKELVSSKVIKEASRCNYELAEWSGDFADMRNKSFALVPKEYDWIIWLDADDIVTNPQKIKEVASMARPDIDGIMVKYNYDYDQFNNVVTVHTNLRMVRNNDAFSWKGRLHETLIENRRVVRNATEDFTVDHYVEESRKDASLARNIEIMEQMLEAEGDYVDPRTLFYLGTAYVDADRYEEAIELLETYLTLSGWGEERAQAHVWLGRMYRDMQQTSKAVEHFLQALYEHPKEPTAYVEMGVTEMHLKHWDKAVTWLEFAMIMRKNNMQALTANPLETTYKVYLLLAQCHIEIGGKNIELAHKLAGEAHKIRPDESATAMLEQTRHLLRIKNTIASFLSAARKVTPDRIPSMYERLDDDMKKSPAIINFMRQYKKPKVWAEKSIAIYCGSSVLKDWGPWSLETGIGGSEEAVIQLSKQLHNLGWKVTVYGEPGSKDGKYDGVVWKNYWELDLRDTFDVFVVWRAPWFFDAEINARKKYLWLHDVMENSEFTKKRLDNIDKVILLSKYHKTVFPAIPEDKVFYSANGIEPADFMNEDGKHKRDQYQAVYMSSHVRGLNNLLDIWPAVKKAVPEAKLKIAYGWQSYDEVNRDNPERMAWKDAMIKQINDLPDVEDLGRIGHQEIVQLIQQSGVWAYPTQFSEIYCITSVKAQAGGAVPVCTDFAALEEMVKYGYRQHMESEDTMPIGKWKENGLAEYTEALIEALKTPVTEKQRQEMMEWARTQHSWQSTAEGWDAEFNS